MKNKKQIIGFSLLIALSVAFILCCLYLPLVYMELHDFSTTVLIEPLSKDYNLIEFIKIGGNDDLFFSTYDAAGPMWLTLATIFFNIITLIGCVFVAVLSLVGIVFVIKGKAFSFKNSVLNKLANFVGIFAIVSFIFQIIGFVVITATANNLIIFKVLYGCFINLGIGVAIFVSSQFVKDKQKTLTKNNVRDGIFFILTAVFSIGLGVILICFSQFTVELSRIIWNKESLSFYELSLMANDVSYDLMNHPVAGDIPLGISFYIMVAIIVSLVFLTIYSIIGAIRSFGGKNSNWLSIRVKRWSTTMLYIFSVLFLFLMCSCMILFAGIYFSVPEFSYSCFSIWAYVEFVLPFVLLVLTRFIGVYNKTEQLQDSNESSFAINNNEEIANANSNLQATN